MGADGQIDSRGSMATVRRPGSDRQGQMRDSCEIDFFQLNTGIPSFAPARAAGRDPPHRLVFVKAWLVFFRQRTLLDANYASFAFVALLGRGALNCDRPSRGVAVAIACAGASFRWSAE